MVHGQQTDSVPFGHEYNLFRIFHYLKLLDILFTSNSDVTTGYYGSLKFLDNQNEFDATFGKNPILLPSNPTSSDITTTENLLLDFSDQCRLDVYMYACWKFYVGNAKVDKNTSMMEVCW